jgi:hypothetical protein
MSQGSFERNQQEDFGSPNDNEVFRPMGTTTLRSIPHSKGSRDHSQQYGSAISNGSGNSGKTKVNPQYGVL